MSRAATSIRVFSWYLFALGTVLLIAPGTLLAAFRFPPANEPWVRVVGMLVVLLGYYYASAARAGVEPFMRWTVNGRCCVVLFFMTFVVAGFAPAQLILFGLGDLAGALWTLFALRADAGARLAA